MTRRRKQADGVDDLRDAPRRSRSPELHPVHVLQREVGNSATALMVQRLVTLKDEDSVGTVGMALRGINGRPESLAGPHTFAETRRYVSLFDVPKTKGGKSDSLAFGFSSSHALSSSAAWVIHVHRSAAGGLLAANLQARADEGKGFLDNKEKVTVAQVRRVGVPESLAPNDYIKNRWANWRPKR